MELSFVAMKKAGKTLQVCANAPLIQVQPPPGSPATLVATLLHMNTEGQLMPLQLWHQMSQAKIIVIESELQNPTPAVALPAPTAFNDCNSK